MTRLGLLLLAFALVAACSAGSVEDPTDTSADAIATEAPTPVPTKTPWPAKWATHICAASTTYVDVGDQLSDLQAAAEELNIAAISVLAFTAGDALQDAKGEIKAAGSWKPGADLKEKMLTATNTMIRALRDIEKGVDDLNVKLIERGNKRLITGTKQISKVTKALVALNEKTGFNCD